MTFEEMFKDAGINGKEYRGAPFWSWNDDLEPEELKRQVRTMYDAGMGGFFMHARIGLTTPYLSKEYMDCHQACIDEAKKLGMGAWLYDEDCWPSGSAGGITPAKGEKYQAKWLLAQDVKPDVPLMGGQTVAVYELEMDGDKVTGYNRVPDHAMGDSLNGNTVRFSLGHFGYIDMLSKEAVTQFIDTTHEAFKNCFGPEFGRTIPGMFTDEPNYRHTNWTNDYRQVPWTDDFADQFRCRRGYEIIEQLPELYYEVGNYTKTRHDFWRTVTELYVEAFSKQIGEWCGRENLALTGHQLLEDSLKYQIFAIGAAMPHYEYMQAPGIDHLCRRIADPILVKQVSSVAHQLDKKRVLSEMFGCSGWNMSFEHQKWIAEWQYVLGVNLMCQHLALYSLKGCRKRDFPPSVFYQQPWWPEYRMVENHFARLACALTSGKHVADVLVLHPMGSAWALYNPNRTIWDGGPKDRVDDLNEEFAKLSQNLLEMHIDFDYGDEDILERHAKVEKGRIVVGESSYSLVIIPPCLTLRESTLDLLGQWITDGGKVIVAGRMPTMIEGEENDEVEWLLKGQTIIENDSESLKAAVGRFVKHRIQVLDSFGADATAVFCQQRDLGNKQLFFLVNIDNESKSYDPALVRIPGRGCVEEWDLDTGEICAIPAVQLGDATVAELRFEPTQSHLIAFCPDIEPLLAKPVKWMAVSDQDITGEWGIERRDPNLFTVDYCRYKIGNGEWSEKLPAIWLQGRLSQLTKPTPVTLQYTFRIDFKVDKPREMTLLTERPWDYKISLNGTEITYTDNGWYIDNSFKKIDIAELVKPGENIVEMSCLYLGEAGRKEKQKELNVESDLGKMWTNPPKDVADPITIPFDGAVAEKIREHNELKYGLEIESIYVAGDFCVYRHNGEYVLMDSKSTAESGDLVEQGYPFFRGRIALKKEFEFQQGGADKVVLRLDDMGAIIAKVKINGYYAGALAWRPLELDVTGLLQDGGNKIEFELTNSCRNLLGPHHHKAGELTAVGPDCFLAEAGYVGVVDSPQAQGAMDAWTDDYSFVPLGLTSAPKLVRMKKA